MAKDQISLALDENTAFSKLEEGLKHAIEASVEIGVYRSDDNWTHIGRLLEQALHTTMKMRNKSMDKIVGSILRN